MITFRKNATRQDEILIYGTIGGCYWGDGGMSDVTFINQLNDLGNPAEIVIRVNTDGGDIKEAWGIYSALNRHAARKICYIDGLAASCGSWVPMACDEIHIAEIGMMMIHLPQAFMMGDAEAMRKEADVLDGMTSSIAGIYASRTGKPVDDWTAAMKAETWYTSGDAVAAGLADTVIPNKGDQINLSSLDLSRFRNTPKSFLNTIETSRLQAQNLCRRRRLDLLEKEAA